MACAPEMCEGDHEIGSSWDAEDGCNTCTCMDDQTIACTAMVCPEDECEDGHKVGESWDADDGCNTCTCTEDLEIGFTKTACPEMCDDEHVPGDSWDAGDGCNICTCTEDLEIQCTLAECPPLACDELSQAYGALVDSHKACASNEDCQYLFGYCGVGIGGCYEIVNLDLHQEDLGAIADLFNEGNCVQWVCDCAPPPKSVFCEEGACAADWGF